MRNGLLRGAEASRDGGSWRYRVGTRWYDVLSGEWPIYRVGRLSVMRDIDLAPGARVLDLCCGTGLNLPLLRGLVGTSGAVVGVDTSPEMLARARQRVAGSGWHNVELLEGDARTLGALLGSLPGTPAPFDAVVATYALTIVPDPEQVWHQLLGVLRPGGVVGIADLGLPSGWGRPLRPLARLACWGGGADPGRAPWHLAERDLEVTGRAAHRAGHVVVRTGRLPEGRHG